MLFFAILSLMENECFHAAKSAFNQLFFMHSCCKVVTLSIEVQC